MKPQVLFIVLLLGGLTALPGLAQSKFLTRTGSISFFSATPIEDIEARNEQVGAAVDVQSGQIAFTVPMKGFQFPRSLMQEHFNENYVESDKYPKATFSGTLVNWTPAALPTTGPQTVQVEGDLTIHGVTKRVRVPGTLEKQGNRLLVKSKFAVAPADYNIEIPALVRNQIAKSVDVTVNLACNPAP
ncbi:YceI family protein [Hymenobacter sp. YC55]|uniref:YceI family protein n=1 Tax=Hymenobacter sp. YC55 TaxID=3034019 RepID=UPI0023F9E6CE|nr:YceI family protein [Hymenobacter sp. YC55]MDF7813265.1 YceI family protein [Hymenobacter sp. YC55]